MSNLRHRVRQSIPPRFGSILKCIVWGEMLFKELKDGCHDAMGLNFDLPLMSPIIASFIQTLCKVCDTSFEEFQYGHHNGYFAKKDVSVPAKLILSWHDALYDFSSI